MENNIEVKNLVFPKAYSTSPSNTTNFPKKILCLESGQIEIWPIAGSSFIWSSLVGQNISIIHTKVKILSGQYISFFSAPTSAADFEGIVEEGFFFIDELFNRYTDENNNYFKIQ